MFPESSFADHPHTDSAILARLPMSVWIGLDAAHAFVVVLAGFGLIIEVAAVERIAGGIEEGLRVHCVSHLRVREEHVRDARPALSMHGLRTSCRGTAVVVRTHKAHRRLVRVAPGGDCAEREAAFRSRSYEGVSDEKLGSGLPCQINSGEQPGFHSLLLVDFDALLT
jgi:hypothetical protein